MHNQQNMLQKVQKRAMSSVNRASLTRNDLNCRFSPSMHMRNHKDFTDSRKGKWKKRVYLASQKAYDDFNEKIESSWENPETKMKAMVNIYGPTSYWGKIEEEKRLRAEAMDQQSVCTEVPDRTPVEYAKAVYDANKILLMVPTAVHDALVMESNTREVVYLLQKSKAAIVLQKALRAFQKRSWERKFLKIDPQLDKLVTEERKLESAIYEDVAKKQNNTVGGGGSPLPNATTTSSSKEEAGQTQVLRGHITGGTGKMEPRIRSNTTVSDVSNSTYSPTRRRSYSQNTTSQQSNSEQELSSPLRNTRFETLDSSGYSPIRFNSSHLTGMEINTASSSYTAMRAREGSIAAVKNSIALQAQQRARRQSNLKELSLVVEVQHSAGKASPTHMEGMRRRSSVDWS